MAEVDQKERKKKLLQGTVISDKMDKTRVVQVKWSGKHKKYSKVMAKASKYKAHDEKNTSKVGDFVQIIQTRPLSKTKRWAVLDVVQKA